MPLQFSFAFGPGSYFDFSFRIGIPKPAPTQNVEPTATETKASSLIRSEQLKCLLFTKLPPETRHIIYRHLLVSGESITHPHRMIGYNETVVKPGNLPCYGIDAGFMQTCRVIYEETMPILYGVNEFQFNSPTDIGSFQRHGLIKKSQINKLDWTMPSHYHYCHPEFHFKLAPYGRLTMLRTIHLKLETTGSSWSLQPFMVAGGPAPMLSAGQADKDSCWQNWSRSVFATPRSDPVNCPIFPALETLTLDLSDWQLSEDEPLFTRAFLQQFRQYANLRYLKVKGVKHGPTLDKFRKGFLGPGKVLELVD